MTTLLPNDSSVQNDSGFERTIQRLRPESLPFSKSEVGTVGIELELQIVNRRDFDLATEAEDLLRLAGDSPFAEQLKPEITQGMIEFNSRVHTSTEELAQELQEFSRSLAHDAARLNVAVSGGGAHPFQRWQQQRIFLTERFAKVHDKFGYLAKQFTVFGQHIHVGVSSGDDAVWLTTALARYVPHFIALSASSPFIQSEDSGYDSARSHVVSAFPTAGIMPPCHDWMAFEAHIARLKQYGVIETIKDLYWDIRPKPEFGTVELRVLDTPFTPQTAALLGAYALMLARWLLDTRPPEHPDAAIVYSHNRFQATRRGLNAKLARPGRDGFVNLHADVVETVNALRATSRDAYEHAVLEQIAERAEQHVNGAAWAREIMNRTRCLNDVVRHAAIAFAPDAAKL
ncbi:MAG TPA: YbdK family carboxylate-amine ligase [Burkholderiaceae bacterium]|nr:YbdK family carboxylate-amine ligase [Burkholderiaceae bacterium]